MILPIALTIFLATAAPRSLPTHLAAPVLARQVDVPLPGPPVRFDYQSVDTLANRLYLSHMGAGELVVFDVEGRKVERTIGDLPRVTAVLSVPSLGRVYASVPGQHCVAIIDAATLRVEARVGDIGFPDGIAFAPETGKVYVSDESGGGELVIDGRSDSVVTRIPLGGEAGNTIYDPGSKHILVAVQTRNELVVVDPHTDRVIERYTITGAAHPHGLCVDPDSGLLFVANDGNATLLTVDLRTMQVVGRHPVGDDPDVLAFDRGLGRLYVASESGTVSVFSVRNRRLSLDGSIQLAHAHTVSVDPRTHLVYLPLQDVGGHPVLRIMKP